METYQLESLSEHMSFLEMLDVLNEKLTAEGKDPVAFDSDCREGICGMCGLVINGEAHGPSPTTTCQLHLRSFSDGDVIDVEPWRAEPFPVLKDLVVDRDALDRIIQAGGYVSVNTGSAPEANAAPVSQSDRLGDAVHRGAGDPPGSVAAGAAGAVLASAGDGEPARRGRLRQLHQHR